MTNEKLRFIDLFAGIGGFRLAFESVGYDCVYSCEINENCRKVYFNNFQEIPEQDIRKIAIHDLPDFEVLTAGFPCQPFSISGQLYHLRKHLDVFLFTYPNKIRCVN